MKTQIYKLGGCLLIAAAVLCGGQALADQPTPVTCGSVIVAPGEYYLASNCAGRGIRINASDVHLKLNGHTMTGDGDSAGLQVTGASFGTAVSQVRIKGPGTITNYGTGIFFEFVSDSHVEQVTSVGNNYDGLWFNFRCNNNHVNNSVFSGNGGHGLETGPNCSDNHLNNNEADSNFDGIFLSPGATSNQINGNTALGNQVFDLEDQNPNCDDNQWKGNKFVKANQPCVD